MMRREDMTWETGGVPNRVVISPFSTLKFSHTDPFTVMDEDTITFVGMVLAIVAAYQYFGLSDMIDNLKSGNSGS